ncbi:hypothetical protein ACO2FP_01165 [Staphylococcus warneri]|uniref:hypothetical protein n=1 Tax=Staphylococcus warneri TaxID=1292 RepID=UPI001628629F|nr:hypothetical protein [Staphylococcus warneri]MCI2789632.1 hypothetical protein [Staphylococcus warneri]
MTESDFKKYNQLVGDRQLPGDVAQRTGHNGVLSDDLMTNKIHYRKSEFSFCL